MAADGITDEAGATVARTGFARADSGAARRGGPDADQPTERVSARVSNLAHSLTRAARRFPGRPGLILGPRVWSWIELDRAAHEIAAALLARGVGKGDRVLVHAPNCEEMFCAMFAVFRVGAIWAPADVKRPPDDIAALADQIGATAFLCHVDYPDHARAVASARTPPAFIWSLGGRGAFAEASLANRRSVQLGRAVADAAVDRDDPCWLFFTGGATGRPKAAVLTHGQMSFVVANQLSDLLPGVDERDAGLVVAPLSHDAGVHQLNLVFRGAPTVLMSSEGFDGGEAWRLIQRWRVTNLFAPPSVLKAMVEHPARRACDHAQLRRVIYAGAPMHRADQIRALAALGPTITQYFGLGEAPGAVTVFPAALHEGGEGPCARLGAAGFERTAMEVSIQDDDGAILPPGRAGEICVVGPAVFSGYWNDPEANARAFRGGWLRTGDVGHLDKEGCLYVAGRASDVYRAQGAAIHPYEIEEVLLAHPDVAEAAVVGTPDGRGGEVGYAVCVPRTGADVTPEVLRAFVAARLPPFKTPTVVVFRESLPRSAYGKLLRRLLREEIAREVAVRDETN